MFDFDDLPEDISQQRPLGEVLPRLPRDQRCPGWTCYPKGLRRREELREKDAAREPRIYVFIFPGCSDTVQNGWIDVENWMPPYVEMATYEWPGHYERKNEELPTSLCALSQDAFDTFREPMSTGRFIVVGHSVGAQIMTCVCQLAKAELGVQPMLAIALDRGAPHVPVYSEHGMMLLEDDPDEYCKAYSPSILKLKKQAGSIYYRTHVSDQKLANDLRPVGWYNFPCPLLVFAAAWQGERPLPGTDDERDRLGAYEAILRPGVGVQAFTEEEFQLWNLWADTSKVHHLDTDHSAMRLSPEWIGMLMDEIHRILRLATMRCDHVLPKQ